MAWSILGHLKEFFAKASTFGQRCGHNIYWPAKIAKNISSVRIGVPSAFIKRSIVLFRF